MSNTFEVHHTPPAPIPCRLDHKYGSHAPNFDDAPNIIISPDSDYSDTRDGNSPESDMLFSYDEQEDSDEYYDSDEFDEEQYLTLYERQFEQLCVIELQEVDLRYKMLGNDGALLIGHNNNLTSVNMSFNGINDEGASELAATRSITSLNLANNSIGDAGARFVCRCVGDRVDQ